MKIKLLPTIGILSILALVSPSATRAQCGDGDSACQAFTDLNQDGTILTISDLILFTQLLADTATAQIPWYQVDINGNFVVDTADLHIFHNYFIYGLSALPWPFFPATCCNPEVRWVCCEFSRGNVNGDSADAVNIVDLTYLVNHLFQSGPAPACRDEGNVNGDSNGAINIVDVTFLVNHLFMGGVEPPKCFDWALWPRQN